MNANASKLDMAAQLQCLVSKLVMEVYDATLNKDMAVLHELNAAILNSDKFIQVLRTIAGMIERGTPKKFDEQEAHVIEMLLQSKKLLDSKKVVPFKDANGITYIGGMFDNDGPKGAA